MSGQEETVGRETKPSASPQELLAGTISGSLNAQLNHLVGVLLTQAEATMDRGPKLDAYKHLLRRELYNFGSNEVDMVWSIVRRAEVPNFREFPTLEEQSKQPSSDHYHFPAEEVN